MPKRIIHLDDNLDIIIDEPNGVSASDRAMVLVSAIMNGFQNSTSLKEENKSGDFEFKVGYSIAKVYYQYKTSRVLSVLEAYSAAIRYIESNPQLFDYRLSQKAIDVLRKSYGDELRTSKESVQATSISESKAGFFVVNDLSSSDIPELTPEYLGEVLHPYINAVIELQHLIDTIHGLTPSEVNIKEIKRNSPISVSLDGASDAIQVIKDTIVPWRRKHAETMARLLEQEKTIEIEAKKAEVVDKKILAREQANKLKLENERLRLELEKEKFQLAIEVLNKISNSRLTSTEREVFVKKLLPVIEVLGLGRLEMINK